MSKAFTKENDSAVDLLVVPRAPLPAGLSNYVTPRGLAALHAEHAELERERGAIDLENASDRLTKLQGLAQRVSELKSRIASAQLIDPSAQPQGEVRFGAHVRVRNALGKEHEYQIVGVDEADAGAGRIAFSAPLARTLLGKRVGDSVELSTPRVTEELEVLAIAYDAVAPQVR
jgi:transcription elongation factor GreB